jgi:hypothetical protein
MISSLYIADKLAVTQLVKKFAAVRLTVEFEGADPEPHESSLKMDK